jgi:predicted Zn finger-like uncharacterized protein
MVELPTVKPAEKIKDGATGAGIVCPKCKSALPIDATTLNGIPETFSVRCPRCGTTSDFTRSSIVTLVAHTRQ